MEERMSEKKLQTEKWSDSVLAGFQESTIIERRMRYVF